MRLVFTIAVYRGCGGEYKSIDPTFLCTIQNIKCACNIRRKCFGGIINATLNANFRSHVKNRVNSFEIRGDQVIDVRIDIDCAIIPLEGFVPLGTFVVYADNCMPLIKKCFNEMGANESRTASNH
jgi:hypothetical protein